ncbi:hypothetical protein [Roseococcus sp. SYP-B2431]|nr:hypothetical protein [Roseococcus sp. SYP-B2431]
MQTHAITQLPRRRAQDESQSALAYWGTGLASIAAMVVVCLFAGLRF